jgi:uncharacterized protein
MVMSPSAMALIETHTMPINDWVALMPLPTVHIKDVPEQGLNLSCVVQPEELALSTDEGRFPSALCLDVDVHPIEGGLSASGVLSGDVIRECVRCLGEYEEPLRIPFHAQYRHPSQRGSGAPRASAKRIPEGLVKQSRYAENQDEEDLDSYELPGERLDLADMLREQVILISPMRPLCREDCLGLCPTCGKNRNEDSCNCR